MSNSLLQKRSRGALPMHKLALPLIGEQFFRILVSSVDTFMLSSYSEPAVAGVGMMGQYVFFLQILFNVICIGSTIILAQYLGAQKSEDELNHVAKGGFAMTKAELSQMWKDISADSYEKYRDGGVTSAVS